MLTRRDQWKTRRVSRVTTSWNIKYYKDRGNYVKEIKYINGKYRWEKELTLYEGGKFWTITRVIRSNVKDGHFIGSTGTFRRNSTGAKWMKADHCRAKQRKTSWHCVKTVKLELMEAPPLKKRFEFADNGGDPYQSSLALSYNLQISPDFNCTCKKMYICSLFRLTLVKVWKISQCVFPV